MKKIFYSYHIRSLNSVYPPQGSLLCRTQGVHLSILCLVEVGVSKAWLDFSFSSQYRRFFNLKNVLLGGWMDVWMSIWVVCDILPPSIFFIFRYANWQIVLIPNMVTKIAYVL